LALRNAVRGNVGGDLALALADSASQQRHQSAPLIAIPPHTQITPPKHTHDLAILADTATMSNLIDAEAGTERFGGYEAELKLVQADLSQQIEQIKETTGEPRKAAISRAERALEEADELVRQRSPDTSSGAAIRRATHSS
jgi:hypothetical protein